MNRNLNKLLIVTAALASSLAAAAPLSVWVGQSKALSLSSRVIKVSVSRPSVLGFHRLHMGAALYGRAPGTTHVQIVTASGLRLGFDVAVTRGAEIYSILRTEPEHLELHAELPRRRHLYAGNWVRVRSSAKIVRRAPKAAKRPA